MHDFSRGSLQHTLGHGGNGRDQGFAFKRDMCGLVVTHTTFLCIPLACFEGQTHCMSSGLSVLVHLSRESQMMRKVQCWTAQQHLRHKRGCTCVCAFLLWPVAHEGGGRAQRRGLGWFTVGVIAGGWKPSGRKE